MDMNAKINARKGDESDLIYPGISGTNWLTALEDRQSTLPFFEAGKDVHGINDAKRDIGQTNVMQEVLYFMMKREIATRASDPH